MTPVIRLQLFFLKKQATLPHFIFKKRRELTDLLVRNQPKSNINVPISS
jgi:hypothetical protein